MRVIGRRPHPRHHRRHPSALLGTGALVAAILGRSAPRAAAAGLARVPISGALTSPVSVAENAAGTLFVIDGPDHNIIQEGLPASGGYTWQTIGAMGAPMNSLVLNSANGTLFMASKTLASSSKASPAAPPTTGPPYPTPTWTYHPSSWR